MIRNVFSISTFIAAAFVVALPVRATVVVSEDFFYQETTVIPTSFGNVRFAEQNYGGGQSGPVGAWDERWIGFGSGTIISDDTTIDTPQQPFISNPFTSRFNGENSVNNDIRRHYQISNTVPAQQTLYFSGRFFAAQPAAAEPMFAEFGIFSPTDDAGSSLVSIGMQGDTFFGRAGRVAPIVQGDTVLENWGSQTTLGNPGLANDNTADSQFHTIVGKLEFNVGGPNARADYNGDGVSDAADYTVWRDHLGLTGGATFAQGDGTGDGNVNQDDYAMWKHNFSSILDRLTVYIDPTGVETSNGSTLVSLGEVGDGVHSIRGTANALVSGGFQGSREMIVDDIVVGTTWNDVIAPVVPRLDLRVNTTTGGVTLVNNSSTSVDLAYYEILSDSGALSVAGWNSLDDQNTSSGAWLENNPSANALRETNLTGSTTLAGGGGSLALGTAFVTSGTHDLLARWGTKQGVQGLLNLVGNVSYVTSGTGSSAAVPEPTGVALLAIAGLCASARFRPRSWRGIAMRR